MGTMQWKQHFEQSVNRPRNIHWEAGFAVKSPLREPLLRSLQTLQRGLSSPGLDFRTKVRASCPREYAEVIDLYVREKTVHSDHLAQILWSAGERPVSRQWTDFAFRRLRRRFGWAEELMVMLTAEMASAPYFRVLYNTVDDPLLREVLAGIMEDQAYHLGFHLDFLREELQKQSAVDRVTTQQAWSTLFGSVLGVVIFDNREVFAALRYDKLTFWTDAWSLFAQVQTGLHGSQHMSALLARDPRIKFVV